ncbi:MAG TPA: hypothetical protein VGN27_00175 [Gaiellaceae bacterium]|jgi:hypothetical protein|nr:hypothetical protein [Gaiellaceae bacterium]
MRIGLVWRREWDPPQPERIAETCKLHGVFAAFAELGVEAEPVVYADDDAESAREQLLALDGALVWVNPVEQGLDRSRLDALLREAGGAGVWVSARPAWPAAAPSTRLGLSHPQTHPAVASTI